MTTEELILQAATRVFQEKGFAAARMDEIAKEAGINRALLHYYFRSKEKMFDIIFAVKFKAFFSGVAGIFQAEISIFDKVTALVDLELSVISQNPELPLFIIGELNRNPERLIKMMQKNNVNMAAILVQLEKQLQEEYLAGKIKKFTAYAFVLNIMGLCLYPFIAKNLIIHIVGVEKEKFLEFVSGRKQEITDFIIAGMKA